VVCYAPNLVFSISGTNVIDPNPRKCNTEQTELNTLRMGDADLRF